MLPSLSLVVASPPHAVPLGSRFQAQRRCAIGLELRELILDKVSVAVFKGIDQRALACALRTNDINIQHGAAGKARRGRTTGSTAYRVRGVSFVCSSLSLDELHHMR